MDFKKKYGPWALVTGASSGIGRAICCELALKGLNIAVVARNESALTELKADLENRYSVQVLPIVLDLASENFYEVILRETKTLDIGLVVPCAGEVYAGEFAKSDISINKKIIDLNVSHPVLLVQAFVNKLISRKRGGILFRVFVKSCG